MKKEYYYCRRIRIKNWLASRGYKPSFSMPDFKNDKYLVWGYEDSPGVLYFKYSRQTR